ncbi:MAG: glycosyltransferase family 39 protein [Anaerolineae bacterium]|nr:glycosyltransferase family 39 protein [Anaerolineae bacterium]
MTHTGRTHARTLALLVVLLAFGFRLWGLTQSSLWYDETFVLHHAQQGPVRAVLGLLAEDNAPPLHGLLLAWWIRVAGPSEFAARSLSMLLGTLGVPVVLQLAHAITRHRATGLGAALAYATLPIFVYYSQEVRMYALAVPLTAGFLWASWRLVITKKGAGAYVVLGLLMLVAHPYAGLAWLVSAIWGTLSIGPIGTSRRNTAFWVANLLLAALSVPIALWALWRVRIDATAVSAVPLAALRWIPVLYGVSQYLGQPWSGLFISVAGASLLAALLWAPFAVPTRRLALRSRSLAWFLLSLSLPVIALFLLTLVKAKWSERYLLPSWGVALVVGVGTGWESLVTPRGRPALRRTPFVISGTALIAMWVVLATVAVGRQAEGTWALALRDEWHPKPDFRGAARYIEEHDNPGDAIVVVGGYATSAIDYYYGGEAHLFGVPRGVHVLDTSQAVDMKDLTILEEEAGPRADQSSSQRLWLVLWQEHLADPTNVIQSMLVGQCQRLPVDQSFTNVGLLLFDITGCRPLDRLAEPEVPLEVAFQAPIQLLGYRITRSDDTWEIDLWWEAIGDLDEDYGVFVHLLPPTSTEPIAQHDHIAGADSYPTSRWREGVRIRDRFFLTVPGGRCRDCSLQIGLYTPEARLKRVDGADVTVIPIPPELQHVP